MAEVFHDPALTNSNGFEYTLNTSNDRVFVPVQGVQVKPFVFRGTSNDIADADTFNVGPGAIAAIWTERDKSDADDRVLVTLNQTTGVVTFSDTGGTLIEGTLLVFYGAGLPA
jgi:hypothetical protein